MDRIEIQERLKALVENNPHLSADLKKELVEAMGELTYEGLMDILELLLTYNEQLAAEYDRVATELTEIAKKAETIAETERTTGDMAKIADLRGKLGL